MGHDITDSKPFTVHGTGDAGASTEAGGPGDDLGTGLEARITHRGAASSVPDDPTAIDADIYLRGVYIGGITLVRGNDGELDTFGFSPDTWATGELIDAMSDSDGEIVSDEVEAIKAAVELADARAEPLR